MLQTWAAKADQEFLYDKPYEDKSTVRVAGPFTVESLSPHRVLAVDENDELIDTKTTASTQSAEGNDFVSVIIENLKTAGVQQAHKEDKINFTSITGWPGDPTNLICAEGRYIEGENTAEKRAGIFRLFRNCRARPLHLVDLFKNRKIGQAPLSPAAEGWNLDILPPQSY